MLEEVRRASRKKKQRLVTEANCNVKGNLIVSTSKRVLKVGHRGVIQLSSVIGLFDGERQQLRLRCAELLGESVFTIYVRLAAWIV